ncbi:Oidioi.mRNA.OKI2018_I69.chr2.g7926.t1.cds [Oikopleura dioica]|uniref:Oidioi.mRNA.OKI2018_I69.chr2.g7926.t1.cds n=1 Tax=Oikopleura dioica TaxID=34765 RepID=A0ABN7TB70_OIKDI|nr:Oidioi.mRNA.OKI2018_I69.chr2.g7926.t1.cds [Oikopleura dioica]
MNLNREQLATVKSYSDIGKSAFSQLKQQNENDEFDGDETENSANKFAPAAKRCLELVLEVQGSEIIAIEKENLPVLNRGIEKVMRLMLIPPMKMSKNVLLLKKRNVKFLTDGDGGNASTERLEESSKTFSKKQVESAIVVLDDSDDFDDDGDFDEAISQIDKSNSKTNEDEFDDDDDFLEIVASSSSKPIKKSTASTIQPEDDFDDDDFDDIDYDAMALDQQREQERLERVTSAATKASTPEPTDITDLDFANPFDSSDDDDCVVIEDNEPLVENDFKNVRISQERVPEGFEDTRFLIEADILPNTFQIIGCIRALTSKIEQNKQGEFNVNATIADCSGTLPARLSHNAFEYMFQMTIPTSPMKSWNKQSRDVFKEKGQFAQKRIYDFFGHIFLRKLKNSEPSYEIYRFVEIV